MHGRFRQTEVEQFGNVVHAAAFGGEDVARFNVAMDHPVRVGFFQGVAGLRHQVGHARRV